MYLCKFKEMALAQTWHCIMTSSTDQCMHQVTNCYLPVLLVDTGTTAILHKEMSAPFQISAFHEIRLVSNITVSHLYLTQWLLSLKEFCAVDL